MKYSVLISRLYLIHHLLRRDVSIYTTENGQRKLDMHFPKVHVRLLVFVCVVELETLISLL